MRDCACRVSLSDSSARPSRFDHAQPVGADRRPGGEGRLWGRRDHGEHHLAWRLGGQAADGPLPGRRSARPAARDSRLPPPLAGPAACRHRAGRFHPVLGGARRPTAADPVRRPAGHPRATAREGWRTLQAPRSCRTGPATLDRSTPCTGYPQPGESARRRLGTGRVVDQVTRQQRLEPALTGHRHHSPYRLCGVPITQHRPLRFKQSIIAARPGPASPRQNATCRPPVRVASRRSAIEEGGNTAWLGVRYDTVRTLRAARWRCHADPTS